MEVIDLGLDNLEPESVKSATDRYKTDSNVMLEFFNEALEKDTDGYVVMNDIYEMFKGWYTNSYNDKKPPPRKKLKEYFDNNGYKVISNSKGIIVKGLKSKDPSNVDVSEYDNNI